MRILFLILIVAFGITQQVFSQNNVLQDTVYLSKDVDKLPNPEKGLDKIYNSFLNIFNIQQMREDIIVDKNGEVSDVTVVDGVGYGSEDAVLKAVKQIKMKWIPGLKSSENVNTKMTLPFKLKLAL